MPVSVILLLVLVIVVVAYFRQARPAILNPVLLILVVLALYGALSGMFRTENLAEQAREHDISRAVGVMVGREIAAFLPDGGAVLVVRGAPVTWLGAMSLYDAELEGMKQELDGRKYPVTVVHAQDPPFGDPLPYEYLPEAEYAALLEKAPSVEAVVLQRVAFEPVGQGRSYPPGFAIPGPDAGMLGSLMKYGYVQAAVEYKEDVNWEILPDRKMSAEEVFDLRYRIIHR